jgi:hypothetical protein
MQSQPHFDRHAMSIQLASNTPRITELQVIPVAGHDAMLMNLSDAHAPFFTRNLLLLKDSAGRTRVDEVPGGEAFARRWKMPGRCSWAAPSVPTGSC